MQRDHPKACYTVVFLQVSFRAIKDSMAGRSSPGVPCWPDSGMLTMLCRDLAACRDQLEEDDAAREALSQATEQCEQLLTHCPGGLDTALCHRHLDAILTALQRASSLLTTPEPAAPASRWQSASRYLIESFRRIS